MLHGGTLRTVPVTLHYNAKSMLCSQASGRYERAPSGTQTQLGAPAFQTGASSIKLFLDTKEKHELQRKHSG